MTKKSKNYLFKFKQFEVSHASSSIHVGIDAVLIGAWSNFPECGNILDIGTGCGVIALMAAQQSRSGKITAIDIDAASVEEATVNFQNSPWSDRLKAELADFSECEKLFHGEIDMIVSNPPYFDSGVNPKVSARMKARHQSGLSPFSILTQSGNLLRPKGTISMILPFDYCDEIERTARNNRFQIVRKCVVRGNESVSLKRVMYEFSKDYTEKFTCVEEELIIEKSRGEYTEDYIALCKEFYLKF